MKKSIPILFVMIIVFIGMIAGVTYYIQKSLAPIDNKAAVTDSELREIGLYDVTAFGADPDGVDDSTQAIKEAMRLAYRDGSEGHPDRGAVFFPEGTYIVTEQLLGLSDRTMSRNNANQFIGSTKGERPILYFRPKASDNSFNNPNNPKPFIYFGPLEEGNEAMGMSQGLRNMEIRIADERTSGTIALRLGGAQDNILHNVKILFEGTGAVGLQDMVGTNSVVQGVEIIGGKIGLKGGSSKWPSFNNITLKDQEDYAITGLITAGPLALSGFHIVKDSAPAIKTDDGNTGYTHSGGAYALSDGMIEFVQDNNSPAIDNIEGRNVTLQNVYIKNSKKIINSSGDIWSSNSSDWVQVDVYGSVIEGTTYQVINGSKSNDIMKGTLSTELPPNDLLIKHGVDPTDYPSPDVLLERIKEGDRSVVNIANVEGSRGYNRGPEVNAMDAVDSTEAFRSVLRDPNVKYVLIPRGIYLISGTISLRENTHLIGVTNYLSEIRTHTTWRPTSNVEIITTVDDKNAETKISNLKLGYSVERARNWFTAIHWKAGKDSVFYNVMIRPMGGECDKKVESTWYGNPTAEIKITGNGGGKFYGLGPVGEGCAKRHDGFRNLLVENTNQPLTLYGFNPEDGFRNSTQAEFKNVKNVAIRGFKCEDRPGFKFHGGSDNIALFGIGGKTGVEMEQVENGFASNILHKTHNVGEFLFIERFSSSTVTVDSKEGVSIYKRGNVDFSVWDSDGVINTNTPTPIVIQSATPTPTEGVGTTNNPTPPSSTTPTPEISRTPTPPLVNTMPPITTTTYYTSECGKADSDNDGNFDIADFVSFAAAYRDGKRTCDDKDVDYGACGGRDVNRDGTLNIADFGGTNGFASRYYPKLSCALP